MVHPTHFGMKRLATCLLLTLCLTGMAETTTKKSSGKSKAKSSAKTTPKKPATSTETKPKEPAEPKEPASETEKKPETAPKETPDPTTEKPDPKVEVKPAKAPAATLKPDALKGFSKLPASQQEILKYALSLTERNLTYTYGSCDPEAGGMDCSGTIYHVLQKFGLKETPRQSDEMYRWTWEAGTFRAFNGKTADTWEMKQLAPGDLLFWTNTVGKTDRNPPITHVMMYLGRQTTDDKPVMFGASDGRSYDGIQRWGVSVFDFQLPKEGTPARFIGYAHLPGKKE